MFLIKNFLIPFLGCILHPVIALDHAFIQTGHWKATWRVLVKILWKILCRNLEIV